MFSEEASLSGPQAGRPIFGALMQKAASPALKYEGYSYNAVDQRLPAGMYRINMFLYTEM